GCRSESWGPFGEPGFPRQILGAPGSPADLVDELVDDCLAARVHAALLEPRYARRINAPAARHQPHEPALRFRHHLLGSGLAGFIDGLERRRVGLERTALDLVHLDAKLVHE